MLKKGTQSTGQCFPCESDVFCLTCRNSQSQCTSCLSGYVLWMTKCISFKNIGFSLEVKTSLENFVPRINEFKEGMLSGLKFKNRNIFFITFTSIET